MRLEVLVAGLIMALIAHNCKCRNRGVLFKRGETSCLLVDGGSYLALRDEAEPFVLDHASGWVAH